MGITTHAKERLQQRNEFVDTFTCAKRNAKVAFISGKCIHEVAKKYPKTAEWMSYKKDKNGRTAKVRLYQDVLYLWKGKHNTLITVIPLPDRFKEEMGK